MRHRATERHGPRRIGRVGLALLLALLTAGSACSDSPVDPTVEVFTLSAVDGEPLPGPFPDPQLPPNTFEVVEGTLTLRPDGTFRQELVMRCVTPPPAGTECEVEGDGVTIQEGRYFRAQGEMEFGGRRHMAIFENDRVTLTITTPPSQGFGPTFVLEYERNAGT